MLSTFRGPLIYQKSHQKTRQKLVGKVPKTKFSERNLHLLIEPYCTNTNCSYKPTIVDNVYDFDDIYPSQRQNLLPTLEILVQNFENFQNFKILEKNSQIQNFFLKISKTTQGPPMTSKGPPPPH